MARLYVLQTGQTTWEAEQRLDSAAGAPLTDRGEQAMADVAQELSHQDVAALYACAGEAEGQTARLIAAQTGAKVRLEDRLREFDYGLWQGLTMEEVRRRHPKLCRQWEEAPASVRPPGGETLAEAQERLRSAVREIVKRHKNGAAVLVLRPVIFRLFRCLAEHQGLDSLWQGPETKSPWCLYEMDGRSL